MADTPKLLRAIVSQTPRWIKEVRALGDDAVAIVLDDPGADPAKTSQQSGDGWITVRVRVEPVDVKPFIAHMACTFAQGAMGAMEQGTRVNVKFDRKDHRRVLLVDEVEDLLKTRPR